MMRNKSLHLVFAFVCCSILALRVFGSSEPDGHYLDVLNGTGDGKYSDGEEVNITAQAPSGYSFIKWYREQGAGDVHEDYSRTTKFTMGKKNTVLVAVFGKVGSWFPPSSEDNDKGILLAENPDLQTQPRFEMKVRVSIDVGEGEEYTSVDDVWNDVSTTIRWFPQHNLEGMWGQDIIARFFDAETGGTEYQSDHRLPSDSFSKSGNEYEISIWYEGKWTYDQLKSDANPNGKEKLPELLVGNDLKSRARSGGAFKQHTAVATLLPIDIEKVWSDQLTGVEANFFQRTGTPKNGTGRADKPYILMGARDDAKAYVKARLGSDIPSSFDSLLLWRLAVKNGAPKPGSFTFDHSKKEVSITADSLSEEGDYQIVVGYDSNKDGQLSESEINVRNDWTFKVVSRTRFNSAVTSIRNAASQSVGTLPNASRLLIAFADHTIPQEATTASTTIARSDAAGLTHNVGVLFSPLANPGSSIEANFAGGSRMARDVAQTIVLNNWLSDAFEDKRQEVIQTFQNLDPSILVYTFDWEFTGTLNFRDNPNDFDLFLALGRISFSFRAEVPVHRSGYIDIETGVRLYGTITDLYDFDYDEGAWVIKDAARVQSGYNKTGDGGRVYRTKVNLNDTPCPVTFNFY